MKRFASALALGACLMAIPAFPAISFVASPGALGANDSVNWSVLGADGAIIPHNFSATSSPNGFPVTGSFATGTGLVADVPASWPPGVGFTAGESLIWTFDGANNDGPLTINFPGPSMIGFGTYLQADGDLGAFTGAIQVFEGASSTTFTAISAAGAPLFLGAMDTSALITKVVFSLTACSGLNCNVNDFAMGTLLLKDVPKTGVPEPSAVLLLGSGLLGLGWTLRKKTLKNHKNQGSL